MGRFGVTGEMQTQPIRMMSDGQKSRLVFAYIAECSPHILFLDEVGPVHSHLCLKASPQFSISICLSLSVQRLCLPIMRLQHALSIQVLAFWQALVLIFGLDEAEQSKLT